jgi:hypothetical protein
MIIHRKREVRSRLAVRFKYMASLYFFLRFSPTNSPVWRFGKNAAGSRLSAIRRHREGTGLGSLDRRIGIPHGSMRISCGLMMLMAGMSLMRSYDFI